MIEGTVMTVYVPPDGSSVMINRTRPPNEWDMHDQNIVLRPAQWEWVRNQLVDFPSPPNNQATKLEDPMTVTKKFYRQDGNLHTNVHVHHDGSILIDQTFGDMPMLGHDNVSLSPDQWAWLLSIVGQP
jgi:dipeptidyl aminopeptidase/acylaminoacyl peptidase